MLGTAARALGIDADEAELPLMDYPSLNEFFVRRLRAGARPWPRDPDAAGSPVEAVVGEVGAVRAGRLIQAKGLDYTAAALLADDAAAARFEGGTFATLYLSPRHYHRIHAPSDGAIARAVHVPGRLLPVNAAAVAHVRDLFPRNERLACFVDGPLGTLAVVAIGAFNVGRISAAFDDDWNRPPGRPGSVTNRQGRHEPENRAYDPPINVRRGQEIMAFHLGSTVVLLGEPGTALDPSVRPGAEIRLGAPLLWRRDAETATPHR